MIYKDSSTPLGMTLIPLNLMTLIHKLQIVEEELDESLYWMEMLIEAKLLAEQLLKDLMTEGNELLSITISSIKTAKSKSK